MCKVGSSFFILSIETELSSNFPLALIRKIKQLFSFEFSLQKLNPYCKRSGQCSQTLFSVRVGKEYPDGHAGTPFSLLDLLTDGFLISRMQLASFQGINCN